MRYPLVLDIETKHTFRQFSDPKKLGVSVVGIYDYRDQTLKAFLEKELAKLFPLIENASYVIGFNIDSFDLPVLQSYYPGDMSQFKTFDILEDIRQKVGRRLALNDVISATLGKRKSGHGLLAIELYKEGKLTELKKYCLDDVNLTQQLFEYGVRERKIYYPGMGDRIVIDVNWEKYRESNEKSDVSLTLPF